MGMPLAGLRQVYLQINPREKRLLAVSDRKRPRHQKEIVGAVWVLAKVKDSSIDRTYRDLGGAWFRTESGEGESRTFITGCTLYRSCNVLAIHLDSYPLKAGGCEV